MILSNSQQMTDGIPSYRIDGRSCTTFNNLIKTAKQHGLLAEYCGANLDAFEECFLDFVIATKEMRIVFYNADYLLADCEAYYANLLYGILSAAASKARHESGSQILLVYEFHFINRPSIIPESMKELCPYVIG